MNDNLSNDMLVGAKAIADFTGFGTRTVYHLAATGSLPTFKVGDLVCARKTKLIDFIEALEARAA
ncbi:helix-turn-helix transcriptional regulator [Brucella anthropi]|uniref:DNA-binding protein n=1 Tax=Brucella anthropi TaxID=529 RepID=A0A6L3Z0Q2_BRUAN|nr:DNA-binding protein [Brucella anthropi]KAB2761989.1 DNA-binding protein [Brucella anthropi]UVV66705.1 DNA-binding protein [Brucella anthropi]